MKTKTTTNMKTTSRKATRNAPDQQGESKRKRAAKSTVPVRYVIDNETRLLRMQITDDPPPYGQSSDKEEWVICDA